MTKQLTDHHKSKKFAEILDSRFTIPGTDIRIGIDPVLGLASGIGDVIGALFSVYFMLYATRLGARPSVLLRMFVNIMADMIIGSIPILGDLFDVVWKANLRNVRLLEQFKNNPERLETQSKWLMWLLFVILASIIIGLTIAIIWLIGEVWNRLFG